MAHNSSNPNFKYTDFFLYLEFSQSQGEMLSLLLKKQNEISLLFFKGSLLILIEVHFPGLWISLSICLMDNSDLIDNSSINFL